MRIRLPRPSASAVVVAALAGVFGYTVYSLSDDAAAIVAQLPEAAQKLRRRCGATQRRRRRDRAGAAAAEELQRTADEAAGPNPAPRGVQRVQIEEPAIDMREYVTWGSAGVIAFAGAGRAGGVLRLFPAGVGRSVQAQAREARGTVASRRSGSPCRSSTRSTRRSSGSCSCASSPAWSSASRHGSRSDGRPRAGGRSGRSRPASSTRFRTSDRSSSRSARRSWRSCSSARWRWPPTSRASRSSSPASKDGC